MIILAAVLEPAIISNLEIPLSLCNLRRPFAPLSLVRFSVAVSSCASLKFRLRNTLSLESCHEFRFFRSDAFMTHQSGWVIDFLHSMYLELQLHRSRLDSLHMMLLSLPSSSSH